MFSIWMNSLSKKGHFLPTFQLKFELSVGLSVNTESQKLNGFSGDI